MARQEADREDLFAEARSLKRRIELETAGRIVVVGFRSDSSLSFFFGQDLVGHFNPSGKLRRAFVRGDLFRADPGRQLTRLRRHRESSQTVLLAHACSAEETTSVLSEITAALTVIQSALDSDQTVYHRAEPSNDRDLIIRDASERINQLLAQELRIADGMHEE